MTPLERFKQDYQGKRVLVMGLGLLDGGVGVARFFCEIGARVTVTDLKSAKELAPSLEKLKDLPVKLVLAGHQKKDFQEADLIIRNPAVALDSPFLEISRRARVKISMETALFAKFCSAPMIGVTGTRGKTTTATLIYELLRGSGREAILGGNVQGVASLALLKKLRRNSLVVLELSSWELQGFQEEKISPQIAVVTNIYPDHLNRYASLTDYFEDKKIIFKYQKKDDFLVLNQENEAVKKMAVEAKSQVVWFQQADLPKNWSLRLAGKHNRSNASAAYQVGRILGLYSSWMAAVFETFSGVAYRLETVAEINAVKYVNDTASTIPEATIAALQSFTEPIVLIAGGADKKLDFTQLGREIALKTKAVVLLEGTATDQLDQAIRQAEGGKKLAGRFTNFKKAILAAKTAAQSGEIVLLSPGCASFGMFVNEYDRGEQFNQLVEEIKNA